MEKNNEILSKYVCAKIMRRLRILAQYDKKMVNHDTRGSTIFGSKSREGIFFNIYFPNFPP